MLVVTRNLAGIGVKLVSAWKIHCWMVLTAGNEPGTKGYQLIKCTHDIPLSRRMCRTHGHG